SSLANNDVAIGALDNRFQLRLLGGRNLELVERLLQVIHESIPLFGRYVQVLMRVAHGAPRVFLRATGRPANHFGDVILEAGWRRLVVGFVHGGGRMRRGSGLTPAVWGLAAPAAPETPPRRARRGGLGVWRFVIR